MEGAAPTLVFSHFLPPFVFPFHSDFLLKYRGFTVFHMCSRVIQLYMCIPICFQILFHDSLLHDVESSSLLCTVGPCLFHRQ